MNKWYLLLTLCIFSGCGSKEPHKPEAPLVTITEAKIDDVPLYIDTIGHIEPIESVNIESQVTGVLESTHFERGSFVQKGQLLFTIDQRPFVAALEKAEAALAQNLANLAFANETAARNKPLVAEDYISQNSYDNLITNVVSGEALVKGAIAEVESAKINLDYCSIYSRVNALSGDLLIDTGNLITEGSKETLVTLNQITPIFANYYISEKDLPRVKRYAKKCPLKTIVTLDDKEVNPEEGELFFIDNAIDNTTGMIQLKSTFANEERVLWPQQFVKVRLILDTLEDAILVPLEAIQNGQ
ncbi:MAG: efflux RND transporter periplasmic adaptor subunit, partial [Simkaniaceae bacterium]|nr:efflux RND transporter periplasmic adaptor subunit [Simkaniaceae bacterium]